ncbi:GDP/GTP exchange factor Sec2p, putative [Paecilomyces variotii No. 5]|uniref:GDP/GTP exchange factor Sec2p, putative n=1 Tax=Byssochlamys spectabilis (strain No. 5 / NBRC 109023) TaxID=1356009 RepID=V5F8F4_BYSSN|nr:GDP/GTP exchange factor Sec2p, putative [Paecilomyces variotii No. 5]
MTSRPNHQRSASSGARSPSPGKSVTKAKSTNALSDLTSRFTRSTSNTKVEEFPESNLNTLRDPRLASTSDLSETSTSAPHHPDLSNEVAALSVKLIQAINNQTTLDDTLAETRQQLESAQSKITELQAANDKYRKDITDEVLVKKSDVDYEILRLKASLAEERAQRALAERAKKNIEQELETLTAALFEEANKMVSAAKKEREAVEKKNEQLRSQIKDMENLMASQQQQLAELKSVMQGMGSVRDETDALTIASTAPSSPCATQQSLAGTGRLRETPSFSPITPVSLDLSPGPSTSFSNLIKTVCRTDVQAYDDFRDLLNQSMNSKPPSRAASGSYAGLNVMGLASLASHSLTSNSPFSSQASLSESRSPNSSASSPQPPSAHTPLKETRFYKRALTEDIEPTLRLDMAPGISWLTRRSVLSGICEGGLVVEPMPPASLKYAFPCSLCGERRKGTENERTHRFRTSDSETAQRYPLCMLCLEKVRSCCEFTGYLRLILDGHIRISDPEDEKEAWEETIRLRERMFWSRIGGGVVPTFTTAASSPEKASPDQDSLAPPTENGETGDRSSMRLRQCSISESVIVKESTETSDQSEDPFHSDAKRASIGTTIISQVEIEEVRQEAAEEENTKDDVQTSEKVESEAEQIPEADAQPEQDASDEKHLQVDPAPAPVPEIEQEATQDRPSTPLPKEDVETAPRLTVSIPGAFD